MYKKVETDKQIKLGGGVVFSTTVYVFEMLRITR